MTTATSNSKVRRAVVTAALVLTATMGAVGLGATPASAETDSLRSTYVTSNGYPRSHVEGVAVVWGSGISWKVLGRVTDVRADGWSNTIEVKLDRKWPASDTGWIQVARAGDYGSHTNQVTGYDPTDGAWVRYCTGPASGRGCTTPIYQQDNS